MIWLDKSGKLNFCPVFKGVYLNSLRRVFPHERLPNWLGAPAIQLFSIFTNFEKSSPSQKPLEDHLRMGQNLNAQTLSMPAPFL